MERLWKPAFWTVPYLWAYRQTHRYRDTQTHTRAFYGKGGYSWVCLYQKYLSNTNTMKMAKLFIVLFIGMFTDAAPSALWM